MQIREYSMGSLKEIKNMGLEYMFGPVEIDMKVTLLMIKEQERENTHGSVEMFMMEIGLKTRELEEEN